MKQLVKNNRSGEVYLDEVPIPNLSNGQVLVRNIFSAISIGTEKSTIEIAKSSLLEKSIKRPDDLKKVIEVIDKEGLFSALTKAKNKLELPLPIGYSSVGEIIDVAADVKNLRVGDIVSCAGMGHAEIISVPVNLCVKVPENVSHEHAAFATISSIALQGVRQSQINIGENVAVIGLGLLGQITMQLLSATGCNAVGLDIDRNLVNQLTDLGFCCFNRNDKNLSTKFSELTAGYGFDCVIITASTNNNDPIQFASEILRDRGHVTVVGNVKMDLPRSFFYKKELSLSLARSYGPGRYDNNYEFKGQDYPIGYVRWTENRNLKAVLDLIGNKKIDFKKIIKGKVNFSEAPRFFEDVLSGKVRGSGFVFEYTDQPNYNSKLSVTPLSKSRLNKFNIGIIGAGSYAQNFILPVISQIKDLNLISICTSQGAVSKHIAQKYNFSNCTTDSSDIINDKDINTVFILTRHDSHANLVIESLNQDKHVYVEKPLAINSNQLDSIKSSHINSNGTLMVGFNRRFSPLIQKLVKLIQPRTGPISINYQINPGRIPADHWSQNLQDGGGRIIGEGCHFIDLCNYIVGSNAIDVKHSFMRTTDSRLKYDDSVGILLSYPDGSMAIVSYLSNGDKGLSKERLEVFSSNGIIKIDDFKNLKIIKDNKIREIKLRRADKGQESMLKNYFLSLLKGQVLINFEDLYNVTDLTIKIR